MRRASLASATSLLLLVAMFAPPAQAEEVVFVSAPGSYLSTFLPVPATAARVEGTLTYANLDVAPHNVVADCDPLTRPDECGTDLASWCLAVPYPKGQCPRFWSEYAFLSQKVPVQGLTALTGGETYDFYCELHPLMTGKLVVLPATP